MTLIDVANGGALVNKTFAKGRNLIANMIKKNSQQFGAKHEMPIRNVNEVGVSPSLERHIASLT